MHVYYYYIIVEVHYSFSVAKSVSPSGIGQDLDLNNNHFVIYGRRRGNSNSASLVRHELGAGLLPRISVQMFKLIAMPTNRSTDEPSSFTTPVDDGVIAPVSI